MPGLLFSDFMVSYNRYHTHITEHTKEEKIYDIYIPAPGRLLPADAGRRG